MVDAEKLISGRSFDIFAITVQGTCPVQEYIDSLEASKQKKIMALLQHTADQGPPRNTKKFKKLEDKIMEFKSFQDRILCAFDEARKIILILGFTKKRDKAPREEIERAKGLLKAYLDRRKQL